jgi:hypothetical protein
MREEWRHRRSCPDAYVAQREANWYVLDLSDGACAYTNPNVGSKNEATVPRSASTR